MKLFALGVATGMLVARARRRGPFPAKVAVVCGGSRGLGRSIALELGRRGCSVAICARTAGEVERTRAEIAALGVPAYGEACDMRDADQVEMFFSNVGQHLGAIDVVVANSATMEVGPIESLSVHDFDSAMDSIFKTTLNAALAAVPRMRARGKGSIVFITSIGAKIGVPHLAPYSAAKFAEYGFAQALRGEVAKNGIHVLTVVPGLMRTGSHVRARFKGDAEREYAWFSASAMAPLLSIDPDRAARKIADAIAQRKTELVYGGPAPLVAHLHDLLPSLFNRLIAIAGSVLPRMPARSSDEEGREVEGRTSSPVIRLVRKRSERLAREHGQ